MTASVKRTPIPAEVFAAESPNSHAWLFRLDARPEDRQAVRRITKSTGFFSDEEIDVAVELIDDRLQRGEESDYHFVFVEVNGETVAYACYGEIECTAGSYDLYWIAVCDDQRGVGIGRALMTHIEGLIASRGGKRLYIDTASRAQYEPTRKFYERCGYIAEAVLKDFYAPADSKVIMSKSFGQSAVARPTIGTLPL